MLSEAVQEFCRCLTPLVEHGDLLDLKMLDVPKKNSVAPFVPTEGASSSEPRAEEPISLHAPNKPPTLKCKEAAHSEELTLCGDEDHLHPLGLPFNGWTSLTHPLEDAASLVGIPHEAWLDLSSLETLQGIVSHNTMMGEVQYQYQSMVASRMSLQLDLPKSSDHPNSPQ